MHEVLVNRLGGLNLPRKSVVRLTDRPDMTLDVYRGRKTTIQQYNSNRLICFNDAHLACSNGKYGVPYLKLKTLTFYFSHPRTAFIVRFVLPLIL